MQGRADLKGSVPESGWELKEDISDSGRLLQGVAKGILEIELLSLELQGL